MAERLSDEALKSMSNEVLEQYRNSLGLQIGHLATFLSQVEAELATRSQNQLEVTTAS